MLTLLFCAVALADCDPGEVSLRLESKEVPRAWTEIEVQLVARNVRTPALDVQWIAAIEWDPHRLELARVSLPGGVQEHPFDGFIAYPDVGLATLQFANESFGERSYSQILDGRVLLATLGFRVLDPRDTRVRILPATNPAVEPGWTTRIWYCGQWVFFDGAAAARLGDAAITYEAPFLRGDVNGTSSLGFGDAISIVRHLFLGMPEVQCADAADADDNGRFDIADAIFLLNHLFRSGPDPAPPYPSIGVDPTPDSIGCESR